MKDKNKIKIVQLVSFLEDKTNQITKTNNIKRIDRIRINH